MLAWGPQSCLLSGLLFHVIRMSEYEFWSHFVRWKALSQRGLGGFNGFALNKCSARNFKMKNESSERHGLLFGGGWLVTFWLKPPPQFWIGSPSWWVMWPPVVLRVDCKSLFLSSGRKHGRSELALFVSVDHSQPDGKCSGWTANAFFVLWQEAWPERVCIVC